MDGLNKNRRNRYDRVMPRVINQTRPTLKSSSFITRHDMPSSVRVGAKPSVSNISSNVFSDLPTVLNDFVPESSSKKTFVVKPRKTIKSLDPSKLPSVSKYKQLNKKPSNIRVPVSAPSVLRANEKRTAMHSKESSSSRSHSRLKALKSEIHAYHETEKLMRIRSSLFKKCGVVLDDVGNIAADKAIQVEVLNTTNHAEAPTEISPHLQLMAIAHDKELSVALMEDFNDEDPRYPLRTLGRYGNATPLTNGSASSPLGRTAGSPPVTGAGGAGPSPMAALMSVTDTLPPGSPRSAGGSPPQPPPQRSASRSSQHSPNSSGSNGGRRSSGSRHVSSTTSVSSTEAGEGTEPTAPTPAPLLKCTLCQERLEDTHFVQCPSQPHHKFCFPCSRDSIKRQQGSEVYCPSGEKCPLANSTVPWAFMQGEIATILGEEFKPKKERET